MAPCAGFFYVEIPAENEKPMVEHFFEQGVNQKTDYLFLRHLKSQLGHAPISTDEKSRKDLHHDLVSADATGALSDEIQSTELAQNIAKIDDSYLELLLTLTSVETIVLCEANYSTGKKGVSLVHGGQHGGELPLNFRGAALCDACGFPPKVVRGSCFVLRSEAYTEEFDANPTWRRASIFAADCRSDSSWVTELWHARERSGALRDDNIEWFKSLPDGDDANLASGETATYSWCQTDEEIEISFRPGPFQCIRASSRDITVRIQPWKLCVGLRDRILMDVVLQHEVNPSGSSWTYSMDSSDLHISLEKTDGECAWSSLQKEQQPQQQRQQPRLQPQSQLPPQHPAEPQQQAFPHRQLQSRQQCGQTSSEVCALRRSEETSTPGPPSQSATPPAAPERAMLREGPRSAAADENTAVCPTSTLKSATRCAVIEKDGLEEGPRARAVMPQERIPTPVLLQSHTVPEIIARNSPADGPRTRRLLSTNNRAGQCRGAMILCIMAVLFAYVFLLAVGSFRRGAGGGFVGPLVSQARMSFYRHAYNTGSLHKLSRDSA